MTANHTLDTKITDHNTAQGIMLGRALREAVETGQSECVKVLLPLCTAKQIEDAAGLCIQYNHMECLVALLSHCEPKNNDSFMLRQAAEYGHSDMVELLLPLSLPKALQSEALYLASRNGFTECVKLLIPVSSPQAGQSRCLWQAAANGHTECVRILIPHSYCKANGSVALQSALLNGHSDCAQLLYPVSDMPLVLQLLKQFHSKHPHVWSDLENRMNAQRQHTLLSQSLEERKKTASPSSRKM